MQNVKQDGIRVNGDVPDLRRGRFASPVPTNTHYLGDGRVFLRGRTRHTVASASTKRPFANYAVNRGIHINGDFIIGSIREGFDPTFSFFIILPARLLF